MLVDLSEVMLWGHGGLWIPRAVSFFPEVHCLSRHPSPVRGETTFRFVKHTLAKIVNLLSHILLRKSVDLGEVEEILGKKKKKKEVATIKEE